jgi:hypothetical protein
VIGRIDTAYGVSAYDRKEQSQEYGSEASSEHQLGRRRYQSTGGRLERVRDGFTLRYQLAVGT